LKATLRVSDLSFGSLSEHFALQNVACKQAIGFIFPIHCQNILLCKMWLASKPSDLSFRFTKKRKTSPPNPFFFRNTKGVETVLFGHISTKCVTQHINKSTEEGVFIYKTFSVT